MFFVSCGNDASSTPQDVSVGKSVQLPAPLRALPASQEYAGKTLEQWSIEYTRWSYAWTSPDCVSPESDPDGSDCNLGQDPESPVFFFARCDDSDLRRTIVTRSRCKVPAGKALLVPISYVTDDDAISDEKRSAEEIKASVAEIKESIDELLLIADGEPINDLFEYSIGPTALKYELPEEPNWYTCNGFIGVGAMTVDPSYLVGYFALFEPPAPGEHELEYASVQSYFNSDYFYHVKARFTVE